jgi:histidinol-phosphate aminotransferase
MYKVCADINDVEYRSVALSADWQLDAKALLGATDAHTKVIWICSPNNPTGNSLDRDEILKVIDGFQGIVIVDEAYSDFSRQTPLRTELNRHPNLVVLNTMSKAWGCAAIRLGMAFASEEIIALFNKVKYPYNVNLLTQQKALEALRDRFDVEKWVGMLLQERARLMEAFRQLPICRQVYPSDANFFLARMTDAPAIYDYLVANGVIVRNRSRMQLCSNCLRITIGTRTENSELMGALRRY